MNYLYSKHLEEEKKKGRYQLLKSNEELEESRVNIAINIEAQCSPSECSYCKWVGTLKQNQQLHYWA